MQQCVQLWISEKKVEELRKTNGHQSCCSSDASDTVYITKRGVLFEKPHSKSECGLCFNLKSINFLALTVWWFHLKCIICIAFQYVIYITKRNKRTRYMSSFGLVWKPTNQSTNEPTMDCFSLAINDVNVYICTVVHTHTRHTQITRNS